MTPCADVAASTCAPPGDPWRARVVDVCCHAWRMLDVLGAVLSPAHRLTARERIVLLALARYRNRHTGACWPSHATIAADAGIDARTVRRVLDGLRRRADSPVAVEWRTPSARATRRYDLALRVRGHAASDHAAPCHDPLGGHCAPLTLADPTRWACCPPSPLGGRGAQGGGRGAHRSEYRSDDPAGAARRPPTRRFTSAGGRGELEHALVALGEIAATVGADAPRWGTDELATLEHALADHGLDDVLAAARRAGPGTDILAAAARGAA